MEVNKACSKVMYGEREKEIIRAHGPDSPTDEGYKEERQERERPSDLS